MSERENPAGRRTRAAARREAGLPPVVNSALQAEIASRRQDEVVRATDWRTASAAGPAAVTQQRRQVDAARQQVRRRRSAVEGVALEIREADTHDLGPMDCRCEDCGALHFAAEEKGNHRGHFDQCCNLGKVQMPDKFANYPVELKRLLPGGGDNLTAQEQAQAKNLRENVRHFNSSLAMASMGAQVEPVRGGGPYCYRIHGQIYHRVGPLHPEDGQPRRYAQLYILDTDAAARERQMIRVNSNCDARLLESLSELMERANPYAASFRMLHEVERPKVTATVAAVKYLYKYVYKGSDRARITIATEEGQQAVDEIETHLNARYVCAPEAMWRIFGFDLQKKSHVVEPLAVHVPDGQRVVFPAGEEETALARAHDSSLMAFFKLNERCRQFFDFGLGEQLSMDSRGLFYYEIPEHFVWKNYVWNERQRGGDKVIGRMYTVSPRDVERFALRILLLNRKGATSFEDLRTTGPDGNKTIHPTFLEAAKALGLFDDDTYLRQSLEEAIRIRSPAAIRSFFATLMVYTEVSEPNFSGRISGARWPKTSSIKEFKKTERRSSPITTCWIEFPLSGRIYVSSSSRHWEIVPKFRMRLSTTTSISETAVTSTTLSICVRRKPPTRFSKATNSYSSLMDQEEPARLTCTIAFTTSWWASARRSSVWRGQGSPRIFYPVDERPTPPSS